MVCNDNVINYVNNKYATSSGWCVTQVTSFAELHYTRLSNNNGNVHPYKITLQWTIAQLHAYIFYSTFVHGICSWNQYSVYDKNVYRVLCSTVLCHNTIDIGIFQ